MTESLAFSNLSIYLTQLFTWWESHQILYPWSQTHDPYEIWISEVMLQQTVVTAVPLRYERWLKRWPTVKALASAQESEVLREWEGLGYYSRGVHLWKAAQVLAKRGPEPFPTTEEELRQLPGIGPYTAAALASFAFQQPSLTLDANLKRVFQRLYAWPQWTKETERTLKVLAQQAFRLFSSRDFNLALMHLGQQVCRARLPDCEKCPLAEVCQAHQLQQTSHIPARPVRHIHEKTTPLLVCWRGVESASLQVFLAHPLSGRFSKLWSFPPKLVETKAGLSLGRFLHTYTRYKDTLLPELCLLDEPPLPPLWQGQWYTAEEVEALALPTVHRKIWQTAKTELSQLFPLPTGQRQA